MTTQQSPNEPPKLLSQCIENFCAEPLGCAKQLQDNAVDLGSPARACVLLPHTSPRPTSQFRWLSK